MPAGKDSVSAQTATENRAAGLDFAAEFERAFRGLWLIAVGIVRDPVLAEDVVQEAALIGYRKRAQFQAGTNFGAWMGQIVRHTAMNQARKRWTRREAPLEGVGEMPERSGASEAGELGAEATLRMSRTASVAADQHWFDDAVVRALQAVSETARACLLLRTIEGLSYSEIAAILAIPEGTAMSHVHRARAAMRQQLAPEYERAGRESLGA